MPVTVYRGHSGGAPLKLKTAINHGNGGLRLCRVPVAVYRGHSEGAPLDVRSGGLHRRQLRRDGQPDAEGGGRCCQDLHQREHRDQR